MEKESHAPVIAILDKAEADAEASIKLSLASIKLKKAEISDIRRAKTALLGGALSNEHVVSVKTARISKHPMAVGDAIVLAVEAGNKSPTSVFDYLADELGVHTTLGSVRARLSPLKTEGRISHDGSGWVPVVKEKPESQMLSDLLG
jgi:hypothetical protein